MNQVIAKIGRGKYKTYLSNETHVLIADEPKPYGADKGPDPYSYLLMALGGCVAMTMRMYADRKEWDLEDIEVRLNQQHVHHMDCEECESDEGYVHIIEKRIKLSGNLDYAQRKRLIEIGEKCPVNKTLLNEIKINTILE